MSDRPTPETDEAQFGTGRVSVDFARRLERERDEARGFLRDESMRADAYMEAVDKVKYDLYKAIELARELQEACEVMIIGICAAAIPHAGERATASLAVSEARKVLTKAKEVLP